MRMPLHEVYIWNIVDFVHRGSRQPFPYSVAKPGLSSWGMSLDLATIAEAEQAIALLKNQTVDGYKIKPCINKPPLRLGVSWDSRRVGEHNTLRDQGSAVDTNVEEVCHSSYLVQAD